jgi:hypothetical protein
LLHWEMGGMDTRGGVHQDLARGCVPIPFPHLQVSRAHTLDLTMPDAPMLCTLLLSARTSDGEIITRNFVHFFVADGYPSTREEISRGLILRAAPSDWSQAEWSGGMSARESASAEDSLLGFGHGFFEWSLPIDGANISKARRIKVLCEASSHRVDSPQTDSDIFPTTLWLTLNGVPVYRGVLRNHPHDARGVLSYLRGGKGAYGYLVHAFAEDNALQQIAASSDDGVLKLRCAVPADAVALGGLTVYGAHCGRFPICPTIIVEW